MEILLEMGKVLGEFWGALGVLLVDLVSLAGDYYFLWLVPLAVGFLLSAWVVRPGREGLRWGVWFLGHAVLGVFIIAATRVYQRPLNGFALRFYGEDEIDWGLVFLVALISWVIGVFLGAFRDASFVPPSHVAGIGTSTKPSPPSRKKGKKGVK